MQHIRQSFRMHQTVFDRDVQQSLWRLIPAPVAELPIHKRRIKRRPNAIQVALDLRLSRPVRRLIGWQTAVDRVDAECEKMVKLGIARFGGRKTGMKEVPIERLQVAEIENDPVSLRDGALIQRVRSDKLEEFIRLPTRLPDAI